jgi:hypothetical protein
MAFFFAMRMTPSASVTVTQIGRPSGIAATARETPGVCACVCMGGGTFITVISEQQICKLEKTVSEISFIFLFSDMVPLRSISIQMSERVSAIKQDEVEQLRQQATRHNTTHKYHIPRSLQAIRTDEDAK